MQGEVALLVIPEALLVPQLVNPLADLAEAVVMVLHGITVSVNGSAYLSCRSVFIPFLYVVRKAGARDPAPVVHIVGNLIPVSIHNAGDLPSGVVLVLLQRTFPRLRSAFSPHLPELSVQLIGKRSAVSEAVSLRDREILKIIGTLLYQLSQRICHANPVAPAVITVGRSCPVIILRLIAVKADLLQ